MRSFFKKFLAALLFAIIYYHSGAQVKTKTFFTGIPNHLIPIKDLVGKDIIVEPPSGFNELKLEAETNENAGAEIIFL